MIKTLVKFLIISAVIFAVFFLTNYLFHFENKWYAYGLPILIIIISRNFLVKTYGQKMDDYLNKW